MAQRGCLRKASDLLADCKMGKVITFGDGELCGYIVTPSCLIPIGKELAMHIQLKKWDPWLVLYH